MVVVGHRRIGRVPLMVQRGEPDAGYLAVQMAWVLDVVTAGCCLSAVGAKAVCSPAGYHQMTGVHRRGVALGWEAQDAPPAQSLVQMLAAA